MFLLQMATSSCCGLGSAELHPQRKKRLGIFVCAPSEGWLSTCWDRERPWAAPRELGILCFPLVQGKDSLQTPGTSSQTQISPIPWKSPVPGKVQSRGKPTL